jgi:hypothetical protein
MAEIRIIGDINNTVQLNRFDEKDVALLGQNRIINNFGTTKDYVEYHIYDIVGNPLIQSYSYLSYKSPSDVALNIDGTYSFLEIDPVEDLKKQYSNGEFKTTYNFFRNKLGTPVSPLYIKDISDDRTELKIGSVSLNNDLISQQALSLVDEINKTPYLKYYLANFGGNNTSVIVNIALDTTEDTYYILAKLYKPLPPNVFIKDTFWIVEEIIDSYVFDINLDRLLILDEAPRIKGPNFSVKVDFNNISTPYHNYNSLVNQLTGSNYNFITSYLSGSVDINVDYTSFDDFVRFSSAEARIANFKDKVELIQKYEATSSIIQAINLATQATELAYYSSSINSIITGFDEYEKYMYFESSSYAYPKTTSTRPFILQPVTSSIVVNWYNDRIEDAQNYDLDNQDHLIRLIPDYIIEDDSNTPYLTFVNMIGQYFDNIWIYLKSITDLYKNENNLNKGISKDVVFHALQSLGVHLYNNKADVDLDLALLGANSGSIGDLNNIPKKDLVAEVYKRIYHNIPLLFKSKGSNKGLDHIVNIFGITGSILPIKEFGGNKKSNTLIDYNTDKIRVVDTQITGSVLSPYVRLEKDSIDITEVRSADYHKIDISFSPQNEIDSVLSSSISSVISNFEIDSYVGDPRFEYSGSYPTLETLRKSHIDSNFTEEFDYSGFIELIKFFDNSLFKMLKDYVPGRSNLLTGTTIRPQHLERIKIKRLRPDFNNQTIYDAEFNGPIISEDNDYLYSLLPSNRAAFYTGELSGSWPDINEDFERTNPNPFLVTTTSSSYQFEHTDFNVTLNNALTSRPAIKVQKLVPIYSYVSGSLLKTGEAQVQTDVQESTLGSQSFISSRYAGAKTTSLKYNTYTSASLSYGGDKSYGKTTSIDRQVRKLGLFSEIVKSRFLPNRNDVVTKYLVDEEGNLTELNQRNKNWEEVQRTFKADDYLNVSLFDNQKYSNQKSLDGDKVIFESGYSYSPILYFSGSETYMYFEAPSGNTSRELEANHSIGLITSSLGTTPDFPLYTSGSSKVIYNVFTNITKDINSSLYYNIGSTGSQTFPSYSVPETGLYNITASVAMDITMSDGGNVTWSLEIVSGSTVLASSQQVVSIVDQVTGSVYNGNAYTEDYEGNYGYNTPSFGTPININGQFHVLSTDIVNSSGGVIFSRGQTIYSYDIYTNVSIPNTSCFDCNSCNCNATLSNHKTIWSTSSTLTFWTTGGQCSVSGGFGGSFYQVCGYYSYGEGYLAGQYYEIPGIYNVAESTSVTLSVTTQQSLTSGNQYEIKLKQNNLSINGVGNYIATFKSPGFLRIASISNQVNQLPVAIPGGTGFIEATSFVANSPTSSITLNQQLSSFVGYTFIPNPPTGSGAPDSALYPTYGDVDYKFNPGYFDLIVHHNNSGQVNEYRIVNVKTVGSNLVLDIFPAFDTSAKAIAFRGSLEKILFLKRLKDETNTIINFIKRDGKTSYGFIIPENIHPEVFANIDTITREVKTKLLEAGGLDGGTL